MKYLLYKMEMYVVAMFILLMTPLVGYACHENNPGGPFCGNCYEDPVPPYSQSAYYSQSGYYSQSVYYVQSSYGVPLTPISITSDPSLFVYYGEDVTVSWDGGNALSCIVTGPSFSDTRIVGNTFVENVTGELLFLLSCVNGIFSDTASTTIKINPQPRET